MRSIFSGGLATVSFVFVLVISICTGSVTLENRKEAFPYRGQVAGINYRANGQSPIYVGQPPIFKRASADFFRPFPDSVDPSKEQDNFQQSNEMLNDNEADLSAPSSRWASILTSPDFCPENKWLDNRGNCRNVLQ